MNKLVALVGIALIAGSAFAADAKKIVIAKAEVKVAVKVAAPAPAQNPRVDSRFDNARLESFSCCGLPE